MAEVIIVPGPREAGALVADHIVREVQRNPRLVLGVATGTTPLPVYGALKDHADAGVDFSHVRAFALDEYVGLAADHAESYHAVIDREVRAPLGLHAANVCVPDGRLDGIESAGERYEAQMVAAGGVDIQLLGIGTTGHLGFNEPGSSFASLTRVKTLTLQTREDNARFFQDVDHVPVHCVTQGLGTILRARHLVLLAFGAAKAEAIASAVEGPVTSSLPASAIQLHPHVTVVIDEAAASRLRYPDYYREAQERKPVWQGL